MRGTSMGVIAMLTASPAFAQAAATDDNLETVVVTGTLLKGINPPGANIINFSSADIKATGALTTSQIYTNIPQLSNAFDVDATNGVNLNPAGGSGTANRPKLYNLSGGGGAATLFLVNGHNMVGEGFIATTPDGAEIPAMVLQRVDVVPGGGSALYGTDAVAGTINLITRTSYEGLYGETHYGTTGNYDQFQMGLMGGHAWSSGNAYLAYEYTNNSQQLAADRPYRRLDLIPLGGTVDNRIQNCAAANVQPNGVGTTYGLNSANVANTPGAVAAASSPTPNLCDPTPVTSTFDQTTNHKVFGSFSQHLADGVDFQMVAWFGRSVSGIQQAPLTTTGTITNANPFFQAIGTETKQTVKFDYSSVFGPATHSWDSLEQYQIEPELKLGFGGTWTGDLLLNYGRSAAELVNPLIDAVSAANDLASSDPLIALDPYNLSQTNATELNKLGNWGNWAVNVQQQEQVRFESDGSLYSLPGGDIKLAAGLQYAYESIAGRYVVGPQSQRFGFASAGGEDNVGVGHRYVESVFGELFVPIVGSGNEMPFVHALNVDVAGRFDHYSDFGGTTNPKIGVTYEPIEGLTLRGNIGTSFNAPSLSDGAGAIDTRVLPATTSTVRPLIGSTYGTDAATDAINANRPSVLIAGGSAGLQPQKANTYSFGFEYQPDFIEGLDLSLTKWHISLYHAINMTPYTSPAVLYTPAYSQFFIINPTLQQLQNAVGNIAVAGVSLASLYQNGAANTPYVLRDARRYNLGNQFLSGLDFNVRYNVPTSWGAAEFGFAGTDYTENWLTGLGSTTLIDNMSVNSAPYQFQAFVGTTMGAFHVRATMNYSASFTVTGVAPQTHASAFEPVNLAMDYDLDGMFSWSSGTTVSLNVNNLFDENPPFYNNTAGLNVSGPAVGGTVNGVTLGRLFEFGLTKKF